MSKPFPSYLLEVQDGDMSILLEVQDGDILSLLEVQDGDTCLFYQY